MRIKETIVVEGRDDEAAVLAAVHANVICTHGYGIRQDILDVIKTACDSVGIIIFTDPDHAGLKIRERLLKSFPDAKQAFLTREQAEKDGDIGIENARPEDILKALRAAGCTFEDDLRTVGKSVTEDAFSRGGMAEDCGGREAFVSVTMEDLIGLGLAGRPDSSSLRSKTGAVLGIGSANTKTFLKRLFFMNISLEELVKAVISVKAQ